MSDFTEFVNERHLSIANYYLRSSLIAKKPAEEIVMRFLPLSLPKKVVGLSII